MKILALDLGDKWIGTALSDTSCLIARPYKTVVLDDLIKFLENLFVTESIQEVVIGNPLTMKGTISNQTQKIHEQKNILENHFSDKTFILWDERLTSKQADSLKGTKNKIDNHSVAAALILDSYLSYKLFQKNMMNH